MNRRACFEFLAGQRRDELVICNVGNSFGEWNAVHQGANGFYLRTNMGMASSVGLGLALALPHRRIWVLDGDGGLAMNLGSLLTLANVKPANVTHFLVQNGVYGSTGGQAVVNAHQTDFAGIARAARIERTYAFGDLEELKARIGPILDDPGYVFVTLLVEEARIQGRLPFDTVEMKYQFARYVERTEGIRVIR